MPLYSEIASFGCKIITNHTQFRKVAALSICSVTMLFTLGSSVEPAQADFAQWLAGNYTNEAIQKLNDVAAERISQLLDGFDKTSNDLLSQGTHESNLLMVQGSNAMQLVVASARAQFGSEMDKQISNASEDLKPYLVEMMRLELGVKDLEQNAVDMEDLAALDIQNLPFAKSYFGVRRVMGTVIVQNKSDNYRIVLRGPRFGQATAETDEKLTFEVKLDGVALDPPQLGYSAQDAVFVVPADRLKGRFKDKELVTLPLDVKVTRDTPKWLWFFGGSHDVIDQKYSVSLMPDYAGQMTIVSARPKFAWKAILSPETQDKSVTGPFTFSFSVANPAVLADLSSGQQKVSDVITLECHSEMRAGRKFPNGVVLFVDDPVFTKGFVTDKYIGAKDTDWQDADSEIKSKWGFAFSTWASNACGESDHGNHCLVPANVMMEKSVEAIKDATGCDQTSATAPQFRNNHTSASVDIVGGARDKPAPWTAVFQTLSYVQDGSQDDPAEKLDVFSSKPTLVRVNNPNNIASSIDFLPTVGRPQSGELGSDISSELRVKGTSSIGPDIRQYRYEFAYPPSPSD